MRAPLATAFLFAVLPLPLASQAVITGVVREDSTGRPLAGVEVVIEKSNLRALSNAAGRYVIGGVKPGTHTALFRKIGFRGVRQAVRVSEVDTAWVNPILVAIAVELAPVEVKAEERPTPKVGLDLFEERRRMGFGKFIDSTMLRRLEHLKVADVLRRHTTVSLAHGRNGELWAESARKIGTFSRPGRPPEPCWMQVVVDGVVLYRPEWDRSRPPDFPLVRPDFNKDFRVSDFEAIEVYHSAAETPQEFSGTSAACGTIVLWSRRTLKP